MPSRIEDYALIGDCRGAALVSKEGSIDWFCVPRFDSDACFAALVGTEDNGFWRIAPVGRITQVRRAYRDDSLTLETELTTDEGTIVLIDFMPMTSRTPHLVRIVTCTSGRVRMHSEFVLRCNYGLSVPWVQRAEHGITAVAGPDSFRLTTPVELRGENFRTYADFTISEGERIPFVLGFWPSNLKPPRPVDPEESLLQNDEHWKRWSDKGKLGCLYEREVKRSLVTLKALTYAPTGGMVAATTTSLPEQLGGTRNWDYRYCWIRDSAYTISAFITCGYHDEARAFREWVLRAAAGMPSQLQIMYGVAGERRLVESELEWLSGYEGSTPVRVGNAASTQLQLDVYGEILVVWYFAQAAGLAPSGEMWTFHRTLCRHLQDAWKNPDFGIWEIRGQPRHFTHSKVMCWFAFECAVKAAQQWNLPGPVDEWRRTRDEIHAYICEHAWDEELGAFVQYPGTKALDASLLQMVVVNFLPADDPRIVQTVKAIERSLTHHGLVQRYLTRPELDGLPHGEGTFLACSFWLAAALFLTGRADEAHALFQRLLALSNDVGLFSEEYDPVARRMLGNFPQALSHVALVHTAFLLSGTDLMRSIHKR